MPRRAESADHRGVERGRRGARARDTAWPRLSRPGRFDQSKSRGERPPGSVHGGWARHAAKVFAMTENAKQDEEARHRNKMANRKAAQDAEVASKTIAEKGLLIVHTGTGKGKSTAAFGLVLRMVGNGGKCAVVQFVKGAWNTGERSVLEGFGDMVRWHTLGEGFTWETQDKARDMAG